MYFPKHLGRYAMGTLHELVTYLHSIPSKPVLSSKTSLCLRFPRA